jgi:hypothetical protein
MPVVSLANLVRVNRAASSSGSRADQRTLSASGNATDSRTGHTRSGDGQLIAVLSPKRTFMPAVRLAHADGHAQ